MDTAIYVQASSTLANTLCLLLAYSLCDLTDFVHLLTNCITAAKAKHVKRGVKEVVKGLRKGEKGLVIIAGDISPIDVITHVPVMCEDEQVPYVFVPSKEDLGTAGSTKRPTSCVMVVLGGKKQDKKAAEDYKELYEECFKEAKQMV